MKRRYFLTVLAAATHGADSPRFAHRQASLRQDGPSVFAFGRQIRGLSGIELQVHYQGASLWDKATLKSYSDAAQGSGLAVPSIAGIWPKGVSLMQGAPARESILRAIDVAHDLHARVILVAAFRANCPNMNNEAVYAPLAEMLRHAGARAKQAGITLGLETSLSPSDDRKLIDVINHPAVRVYFDADNTEFYGHNGQSLGGIDTLGVSRICQVHAKNEDRLLEAQGRVDWAALLAKLRQAGYKGWITFETRHAGPGECISDTGRNIAFATGIWNSSLRRRSG